MPRAPALRLAVAALLLAALPGCVSITVQPRALLLDSTGHVAVQSLDCTGPRRVQASTDADAGALDPAAIRLITWNVHKEGDRGWEQDLAAFAAANDVVLLQEVVLEPALRRVVEGAGLRWVMASSFLYSDVDIGVLTGSRKPPLASCTERAVEPLIRIPKSAVITWYHLAGHEETLAIVNVHAINFALTLGGYRAQLGALADALADHPGPIIFAGDLNTWTGARDAAMQAVADRLGLKEVSFREDRRTLFLGKQLDHVFVRGLDLVDAQAIPVHSSDHNPVQATFRVAGAPAATPAGLTQSSTAR